MRERTTWIRHRIANQLRKVAEDPRSMNQDHIQQQPAADAYVIGDGSPSQFAEDVNSGKGSWKSEQGADGNTKRDEIGLPAFRGDTFNNPETSPGVSPSRQASLSTEEVHARAKLATKAARIMLPKTASEQAIEDQALLLMDMPTASLQSTLTRLAQEEGDDDDDDDDEDEDEGQDKQAQQEEEEEEEEKAQAKQGKKGGLPPEFLEQQQKMKDKAKDGDKDEKKDEKKEARSRKSADQDDEKKQSQQDDKKQNDKEARSRKAQQDDDGDDDKAQDKQARSRKAQQQDDEGQDKEAADQDEKKDKEACGEFGKEATALIRQAAVGLLSVPQAARQAAYQAMLPMLVKTASQGLEQMPQVAQQQQLSQQQLQSQVQQLVQQAMQQQVAQGQQQQQMPQLAQGQQDDSQALVDQLFQEPDDGQQIFASSEIQMDSPSMDIGDVSFGPEDAALNAIFAAEPEVQRAMQANAIQNGTAPMTRTASTRTVGTRPTEGVSHLGGAVSSTPSGASEEINRLSGMWSTAPDVSGVFRS